VWVHVPANMTTVVGHFCVIFECATKRQGSTGKILRWREYIPLRYVSDDLLSQPPLPLKIFEGVGFRKFDPFLPKGWQRIRIVYGG